MNVNKALDEMGAMPPAEVPPFLFTRIQARIQYLTNPAPATWRWALAVGMAAVLAINISLFISLNTTEPGAAQSIQLAPNHDIYHDQN